MGELSISEDAGYFTIEWREGYRKTQWLFDASQDLVAVLKDILSIVEPNNKGPLFLQAPYPVQKPPNTEVNEGLLKAEREAKEQEERLRAEGLALAQGLGVESEGVPIFDPGLGEELPPVDWSQ